jgi:hypothetical protein
VLEGAVAAGMPEPVVDSLEVVDVNDGYRSDIRVVTHA